MTCDSNPPDTFLRALARAPDICLDRVCPELRAGELIDGTFRIRRELGRGGMAVVYLARDTSMDRDVALKWHRGLVTQRALDRLSREAKTLAKLSHPNVVTAYASGRHNEGVYIAMAYVRGHTAREWSLHRPWREIVATYASAGKGLAAAHELDIVHRDFKPDNVLVDTQGRVVVVDFGLARAEQAPPVTLSSNVVAGGVGDPTTSATAVTGPGGTPGYLAPEVERGAVAGPAADQFAWCVSLAEALSGVRPRGPDSLTSSVPVRLRTLLRRGLHSTPGARFSSMDTLLAALARCTRSRVRPVSLGVGVLALSGAALSGLFTPESQLGRPESQFEILSDGLFVTDTPNARRIDPDDGPPLQGNWSPPAGSLLVTIERVDDGYRYMRSQGRVRRPTGYYEEGILALVQLDGRQYLRGQLEQTQRGRPDARISVEFEVVSPTQLHLRGSIFTNAETGEVQEFFAGQTFTRDPSP